MVRAPETTGSAGELRVDLPDLRGYAQLVDEIRFDLSTIHTQVETYCADADFGKIVEDLTDDYATLLPQLKELLAENATLMGSYAVALDQQALDFGRTDGAVADSFGGGGGVSGGSGTNTAAFAKVSPLSYLENPYPSESELPEVSFGFMLDKLCWALEKFCGWDLRAEVTDWIAGDVVGLSTQARCWEIVSGRLDSCEQNVTAGQIRVFETWSGQAANSHAAGMYGWTPALQDQSTGLATLGEHLKEVAAQAVSTAQFVVDCVRLAVDLITSAWALQYIPVYGQAKFIQKAWDAYKTASKATAYLRMLFSLIRTVKSFIEMLVSDLTVSSLPPKPLAV